MSLDARLLAILVDPNDHGSLKYVASANVLFNPRTHQVYDVRNDIAVMLPDESRVAVGDELDALLVAPGVDTGTFRA